MNGKGCYIHLSKTMWPQRGGEEVGDLWPLPALPPVPGRRRPESHPPNSGGNETFLTLVFFTGHKSWRLVKKLLTMG